MAENHLKIFSCLLVFLAITILFLSLTNASSLEIFSGTTKIGSNTTTTGAFVAAYINGVMKANCTVGKDCGNLGISYSYFLAVEGSNGNAIVLTIYNITANDTYTFAAGSVFNSTNLTITQLANSAVCAYSEACSGGYCCSGATEYHGNGIGACQASACTAPATTTSGGGGGGGGGGTTEVSQTKYSGLVSTGGTKEIIYTKEELKITGIELTAASEIDNAGITVKESTAAKAGIAISTGEGGTYKYLEIIKTLVTDSQISKVKISFKVEKSWYTANSYDFSSTVLRRNVNGAWQDLPTTKTSEDDSYYYFEAESPGLSYFAITASKIGAVIPPAEKKAVCGDSVCELDENCGNCAADCACTAEKECVDNVCKEKAKPIILEKIKTSKMLLAGIIGAIILVVIIILLAMPKKKKF